MKYAKKMILVPADRDNPTETKLSELDKELNLILKRKNENQEEKIKMYNQVLSRYLALQHNAKHVSKAETEVPMNTVKRKLSEYELNENKKLKRSQTYDDIPEEEYDYDDEFQSLDNASNMTTRALDLNQMEKLNDYVMKKSPSFDLIKENEKDQNKYLTKYKKNQEKREENRARLTERLFDWIPY